MEVSGNCYFSKSDFKVRFKHVFFMKPPGSATQSGPGTGTTHINSSCNSDD